MTEKNDAHPSAQTTVSLFEERYKRVEEELKKYEHQAGRSRWTDRIVTVCEYILGGMVTAIPAFAGKTRLTDTGNLALTVGVLGALVITAKIIRERFKPGQVLMGARTIVATLTCGIMQADNERQLEADWTTKMSEKVEFLSNLIGWVEEVEIAGLASATQIHRPAVKYLPSGRKPRASHEKPERHNKPLDASAGSASDN
jgi:hypothetical protein